MLSNYPPGVTGNEWEIAGPDYEAEVEVVCPTCDNTTPAFAIGFHGEAWLEGDCSFCGGEIQGPYCPEDDFDHAYDNDWDAADYLQTIARIGGNA